MFAQRLRELRRECGLTQIQLAQKIHVSNGTIGMWETGKREPDFDTTKRLADFFHVSVDYLVGSVNDPWFYLDVERTLREINGYGDEDTEETEEVPLLTESESGTFVHLSKTEQSHIKKYRLLDQYGKEGVDGVMDVEWRRCTTQAKGDSHSKLYIAAKDSSRPEPEVPAGLNIPTGNHLQLMQDKDGIDGTPPAPEET